MPFVSHGYTMTSTFGVQGQTSQGQGEPSHCGTNNWDNRSLVSLADRDENHDLTLDFDNDGSNEMFIHIYRFPSGSADWSEARSVACSKSTNPNLTVEILKDYDYIVAIGSSLGGQWSGTLDYTLTNPSDPCC